MKKEFFFGGMVAGWFQFFLYVSMWGSIWEAICMLLAMLAAYCTVRAIKRESSSLRLVPPRARLVVWISVVLFIILFSELPHYLPSQFAKLCPLLLIILMSGMLWLWPSPRQQEEEKEPLGQKDSSLGRDQ